MIEWRIIIYCYVGKTGAVRYSIRNKLSVIPQPRCKREKINTFKTESPKQDDEGGATESRFFSAAVIEAERGGGDGPFAAGTAKRRPGAPSRRALRRARGNDNNTASAECQARA